jgi:hypothetical protein
MKALRVAICIFLLASAAYVFSAPPPPPAVIITADSAATVTVGAGTNVNRTLLVSAWTNGFRATLIVENQSAAECVRVYRGAGTNSTLITTLTPGQRLIRSYPTIDNSAISATTTSSATATTHVYQDGSKL